MSLNKIQDLNNRNFQERKGKNTAFYAKFKGLIAEIQKREFPDFIVEIINSEINILNSFVGEERDIVKMVRTTQRKIVTLLEKELKIVPKNYYQKYWMVLGMSVFGMPFGVAFGFALGSMAFLGLGLPIGMAIGIGIGNQMDKKAKDESRQLDIEVDIF